MQSPNEQGPKANATKKPISYDISLPYTDVSNESIGIPNIQSIYQTGTQCGLILYPLFYMRIRPCELKDKAKHNLLTPNASISNIQLSLSSIVEVVQLSSCQMQRRMSLPFLSLSEKLLSSLTKTLLMLAQKGRLNLCAILESIIISLC